MSIREYERMKETSLLIKPTLYTMADLAASLEIVETSHKGGGVYYGFVPMAAHGVIADDSEYCGEDYN